MLKPPDESIRLRATQTVLERFRLFQPDSPNVELTYKYAVKREDKITPITTYDENSPPPFTHDPSSHFDIKIDGNASNRGGSRRPNQSQANRKPKLTRIGILTRVIFGVYLTTTLLCLAISVLGFVSPSSTQTVGEKVANTIMMIGVVPLITTIALTFYFLPTLLAFVREHRNLTPILIINLTLGFLFLGWVVAIAWAFSSHVSETRQSISVDIDRRRR